MQGFRDYHFDKIFSLTPRAYLTVVSKHVGPSQHTPLLSDWSLSRWQVQILL